MDDPEDTSPARKQDAIAPEARLRLRAIAACPRRRSNEEQRQEKKQAELWFADRSLHPWDNPWWVAPLGINGGRGIFGTAYDIMHQFEVCLRARLPPWT
jgi:hypothetical protein